MIIFFCNHVYILFRIMFMCYLYFTIAEIIVQQQKQHKKKEYEMNLFPCKSADICSQSTAVQITIYGMVVFNILLQIDREDERLKGE